MQLPEEQFLDSYFLFIDESGDFDFSESGTKYFVMAGVLTHNPVQTALPLQTLRYRMLEKGMNVSSFHASPDLQLVRDSVFEQILNLKDMSAHVVYGSKAVLNDSLRNTQALHFHFTSALMRYHLQSGALKESSRLIVVIDQSLTPKKQSAFHASIKPLFKEFKRDFQVFFQSMKTDYNGQIADYVAWAKFKQLERDEHRPWQALTSSLTITEQQIRGRKAGDSLI